MVLSVLGEPDVHARTAMNRVESTGGAASSPMSADSNEPAEKKGSEGDWWGMADWPREKKAVALNAATLGTLAIIGAAKWDYGSTGFHFEDEGWFDRDTPDGGADKLGHAFLGYTLTGAFSYAYREWGFSDDQAFVRGAINSAMITTAIEIGDGFSKSQGFCWQDEVMDMVGVGIAYLRYRVPGVREKVDFRIEWVPSSSFHEKWDPFTDYSGQKNVVALKPSGFFKTEDPFWKAIEFQVGYYTRGYAEVDRPYLHGEKRYGYVAIGLNMTYLIEALTGHTTWGVFEYYQVPYTYLPVTERFD
jgi:hypothetical protein